MTISYGLSKWGIQNDFGRYLLASYNLFVLFSSLLGDAIIIIATTKYRAIKLHRVLVAIMQHLAVADLLITTFNVFPVTLSILTERWILGELMCRLQELITFWCYSTVLVLTCTLSTTKLLTIKFPFRCRTWSARRAHQGCLCIWVASLLSLLDKFPAFFSDDLHFAYEEYSCICEIEILPAWLEWFDRCLWSVHMFLIIILLLTSVMLVVEARKAASKHQRAVRWQGILTVVVTGAVFVISFGPIVWMGVTPAVHYNTNTIRAANFLTNLNVMANFFIYALTVQSFREFLKQKSMVFRLSCTSVMTISERSET